MSKVVYDEECLKQIADKYNACADVLVQALIYHQDAKVIVENNYAGQAIDVIMETFDKLKQHMELLKMCCETTATYVSESLAEMQLLEESMANSPEGA